MRPQNLPARARLDFPQAQCVRVCAAWISRVWICAGVGVWLACGGCGVELGGLAACWVLAVLLAAARALGLRVRVYAWRLGLLSLLAAMICGAVRPGWRHSCADQRHTCAPSATLPTGGHAARLAGTIGGQCAPSPCTADTLPPDALPDTPKPPPRVFTAPGIRS